MEYIACALDPRTKDLEYVYDWKRAGVWVRLEVFAIDYHTKTGIVVIFFNLNTMMLYFGTAVASSTIVEKPDDLLPESFFGFHHPLVGILVFKSILPIFPNDFYLHNKV